MATVEQPATSGDLPPSPREDQSPREEMVAMIKALPDDSTYDELLRELYIAREVRLGMKDVDEGRVVSHGEALKQIRSCQK